MAEIERIIVITGAASGIGAATVRAVAGEGAALLLNTRKNRDGLDKVAEQARAAGSPVATVLGDLTADGVAASLIETACNEFGRVDQIVSNAGFADRRRFGDVDADALRLSFGAITEAFFGLVSAALPYLQDSNWGRVVAVSSFVAHEVGHNDTIFPVSAAAKGGLESLARTLAYQLAETGTTVNCVSPGYTKKDPGAHTAVRPDAWKASARAAPMNTMVMPEDVAAAIAFLLSRDAPRITGQVLNVDAGLSLF